MFFETVGAGDLNGDGAADARREHFLVPFATPGKRPATIALDRLEGSDGFSVDWRRALNSQLISRTPSCPEDWIVGGDVDGDGIGDVLCLSHQRR